MKPLAILVALILAATACSNDGLGATPGTDPTTAPTTSVSVDASAASAEMMAAALQRLVTKDHTFGQGPPPFTEYLILSSTDPAAGSAVASGRIGRPLTVREMETIAAAIGEFGPTQWIERAEDFIAPDLTPVVEGAAILGVGEPVIEGETGLVPISLWCGGTCGAWHTYRVNLIDGMWIVEGIEGPRAIS